MRVTSSQLKAARNMVGLTLSELAKLAKVSPETISDWEDGSVTPRKSTIEAVWSVLDGKGIELIGDRGVALRDDMTRIIEGDDAYLRLLDDVFTTLADGGEALFSFVCNKLSPPSVINKQLLLRHNGIKFRMLVEEGDTYCLYPLREYRWIPKEHFHNNTQIIYGNKVGAMITDRYKAAVIIRNRIFADTQRGIFEMLWNNHKMPPESTAPEKAYE